MIAKNIKGSSFSGCVKYVSKEDSELLKAEGVFAENTKSIIESFEMQRSMRAEIKQPVGHIPISFAPEDREKMSNEFMVKLAQEYMQKMGITNTQYVIIRHHDTENEHVHVVYNRINNDLKLTSVHNDYKRNVATCKELKEKYNLTFGKDKSRVNREKLHGLEAVKYAIHDIVKENLGTCKEITELKIALYGYGVSMHLKCKRGSDEVQGVSFSMNGHKFKASQIDRKFSYKNLLVQLRANSVAPKLTPPPPPAPKPSDDRTIAIYGVPLTDQQRDDFYAGKAIFLKDMVMNGQTISRYVRLLDDKRHVEVAEKNIPVEVGGVRLTNQQRNDLRSDKSVMISGAKIDGEILDKLWLKYSNEQSCIMGSFRDPDAISSKNSATISHGQHLQQPQSSLQPQYEERHTQSHSDESSSGALSLFDMPSPSNGADQDDIDNAEMAKNLQQKITNGEQLPTLAHYLKEGQKHPKLKLILEMKPHRTEEQEDQAVARCMELVKKYGVESQTEFISFSMNICEEFALVTESPVSYLNGEVAPAEITKNGIDGDYHYEVYGAEPNWIAEAESKGVITNSWTINDLDVARSLISQGIDYLTTDYPEEITTLVERQE